MQLVKTSGRKRLVHRMILCTTSPGLSSITMRLKHKQRSRSDSVAATSLPLSDGCSQQQPRLDSELNAIFVGRIHGTSKRSPRDGFRLSAFEGTCRPPNTTCQCLRMHLRTTNPSSSYRLAFRQPYHLTTVASIARFLLVAIRSSLDNRKHTHKRRVTSSTIQLKLSNSSQFLL